MQNRNIVFTAPNIAEVIDSSIPEPGPGQVLVRTVRSSISSGTERANLIGDPMVGTNVKDGAKAVFPRHLGYSTSGIVEKVGEGVASVRPGDRVAMVWTKHSAYQCVSENRVFPLPEGVSFEIGALTCIATFPMAALRKCRLEFGESVLVVGQGILGQLAVKLARAAGAIPVAAADLSADKRDNALRLGADAALDPAAPDFAERARQLTDGGFRVAIEVTGVDRALDSALDAVARFARIALLGCTRHSTFAIDYYRKVHGRGVTLVGAHTLARPEFESAPGWWTMRDDALAFLRLVDGGRISLDGFVEEVHPVSEAPAVYTRLAAGGPFPNVQFDWTK